MEQAQLNLQYTNITAPINGRSGALLVHAGDLIRANDTDPMVTINQLTPIDVTFSVPGRLLVDIQRFNAKSPLSVTATSQASNAPCYVCVHRIRSASRQGDVHRQRGRSDDRDDQGQGHVPQHRPPAVARPVRQRRTSRCRPSRNAIVVPAMAVQTGQQGKYVFVVKPDQTVELRTVAVERQRATRRSSRAACEAGETVVTDGQLRLTPGAQVSVTTGGDAKAHVMNYRRSLHPAAGHDDADHARRS